MSVADPARQLFRERPTPSAGGITAAGNSSTGTPLGLSTPTSGHRSSSRMDPRQGASSSSRSRPSAREMVGHEARMAEQAARAGTASVSLSDILTSATGEGARSIADVCAKIEDYLYCHTGKSLAREFYEMFPAIMTKIFGVEGQAGWMDTAIRVSDKEGIHRLLAPTGILFKTILAFTWDDFVSYELGVHRLPHPTREALARGDYSNLSPLYDNCRKDFLPDQPPHSVTLNMFQYFMICVMQYPLQSPAHNGQYHQQQQQQQQQRRGTGNSGSWMSFSSPLSGNGRGGMTGSSSSSSWRTGGGSTGRSTSSRFTGPLFPSLIRGYLSYFFPSESSNAKTAATVAEDYFRDYASSPSVNYTEAVSRHYQLGRMFLWAVAEFWLTSALHSPAAAHAKSQGRGGAMAPHTPIASTPPSHRGGRRAGSSAVPLSISEIRHFTAPPKQVFTALIELVDHISLVAGRWQGSGSGSGGPERRSDSSAGNGSGSQRGMASFFSSGSSTSRSTNQPSFYTPSLDAWKQLQQPLYSFLLAAFRQWPESRESHLESVVRVWLAYVQPWQSISTTSSSLGSIRGGSSSSSDLSRTSNASNRGGVLSSPSSLVSAATSLTSLSSRLRSSPAPQTRKDERVSRTTWSWYMQANALFYTKLISEFLELAGHLDYVSSTAHADLLHDIVHAFVREGVCDEVRDLDAQLIEIFGDVRQQQYPQSSGRLSVTQDALRQNCQETEHPPVLYPALFSPPMVEYVHGLIDLLASSKPRSSAAGSRHLRSMRDLPYLDLISDLGKLFEIKHPSLQAAAANSSHTPGHSQARKRTPSAKTPRARVLADEVSSSRLSPLGVSQIRKGLRVCSNRDVPLRGDPARVPIQSNEFGPAVRLSYKLSQVLNAELGKRGYRWRANLRWMGRKEVCIAFIALVLVYWLLLSSRR